MYQADNKRYDNMKYLRCGMSGVLLPRVALGFWHNFGSVDSYENQKTWPFVRLIWESLILIWLIIMDLFMAQPKKILGEL